MPTHPRSLLWLTCITAILLVLLYQIPRPQRVDIGAAGDSILIDGFFFAEGEGDNTFRWSGPAATITFPGAGARDWTLDLRLGAPRPSGQVTATISLAGSQSLGALTLDGAITEHTFPIARNQITPDGNVRIDLTSPTFTAPPDTRDLGLQVDWAALQPAGSGLTIPPWSTLLGVVLIMLLFGWGLTRAGMANPRAWWVTTLLFLAALLAALYFYGLWLNYYLPWLVLIAVAFWLVSAWMREARWWEWLALVAVALSAYRFGVRAWEFYGSGLPPGDFSIYFSAGQNIYHGQPIYDFKAASEMPNGPVYKYPPLFAILLAPFARFPAWNVAAGWYLLNLGLYVITFVLLLRAVIAASPQRLAGQRHRIFTLFSALVFLNFQPAWESLIRGQMDILILTALVGGLWFYQHRRAEWIGGALLAFVAMLKLYPALLWVYLLWQKRWSAALGFIATFALLTIFSGAIAGWDVLLRYVSEILSVQTAAVPYPENQSWTGILSRFVVPAADTTWYTTIPFAQPARLLLYALVLITLVVTARWIWRPAAKTDPQQFLLGYAATLLVMVMIWPTSWIHYETLLLPAIVVLLYDQFDPKRRRWPVVGLWLASYLLVALGNEYTVLTPWIHQDAWPRLLQSYKFYGMLILWGLAIYSSSRSDKQSDPLAAKSETTYQHSEEVAR